MMNQEQQWRVLDHAGNECGPYTAEQLRAYAIDGTISPTTQIWAEGLPEWIAASQVEGLFDPEPATVRLLAGSAARGGISPAGPNRTGFPAGVSRTVAQPSSGARTLIVLAIAIPSLIIGTYVLLTWKKPDSSTAQRPLKEASLGTEASGSKASSDSQTEPGVDAEATGGRSSSNKEITPAQWKAIAAIEQIGGRFKNRELAELQFLEVSYFPKNGLARLKVFPGLRTLDLDCGVLTDEDLALCKDLAQLTGLSFSGNQITDAGLAHLKNMSQLKTLTMDSASITDEGLAHLESLSELKDVVIYSKEGSITDAGIKRLQAALPTCMIRNESSDERSSAITVTYHSAGQFEDQFKRLAGNQVKLPDSDEELEEFLLNSTWRSSEYDGASLEFQEDRMTIMTHAWAYKISGRRTITIYRGEVHSGIGTSFDLWKPSAYVVFAEDMSTLTVRNLKSQEPEWTASLVGQGQDEERPDE